MCRPDGKCERGESLEVGAVLTILPGLTACCIALILWNRVVDDEPALAAALSVAKAAWRTENLLHFRELVLKFFNPILRAFEFAAIDSFAKFVDGEAKHLLLGRNFGNGFTKRRADRRWRIANGNRQFHDVSMSEGRYEQHDRGRGPQAGRAKRVRKEFVA